MQVAPRYEGPAVISMGRTVPDPGLAVTRQRRRLEAVLGGLTAEQWAAPSRCEGWAVRDVIAHLVTVNRFWESSVRAGAAGEPTRILANFDPAAHPPLLIASMAELGPDEMLAEFIGSNDGFLGAVADLTPEQWALPAESPAGHVPIAHVVDHGVWDSWIHERDICLPLGLTQELVDDEIQVALRYAAAIGPGIGVIRTDAFRGSLAVDATDPEARFVLDVADSVHVREGAGDPSLPCLRGDAVDLIEGLSLRTPMPVDAPAEWNLVIQGLVDAFTIV